MKKSIKKCFLTPRGLYIDSFKLARMILDSGFRPDFIVALWRGGTPVGIIVQEFLDFHGLCTDHIAIRTSAYEGIGKRSKSIRVHGLKYIAERVNPEKALLLVDDVFDSGSSMKTVLDILKQKTGSRYPRQIKIAVLYYKPDSNRTRVLPDFFLHETDKWLVFPHELAGLTHNEIRKFKDKDIQPFFRE